MSTLARRPQVWLATGVLACFYLPAVALAAGAAPAAPRLPAITGPLRLNPDAAARMAVERSTDTALAGQSLALARAGLMQARAMTGWQVAASGAVTKSGPATSFTSGDTTVTLSPTTTYDLLLKVSKPLYLGSRDRYSRHAAQAGIEAAGFGEVGAEISVALAARQALYGLLRDGQLSAVAQEQLTATAEHLRIAEAMFREGAVARFEVVQAQTAASRAKGGYIAARNAVEQRKALIRELLVLDPEVALEAEEGVPPQQPEGDVRQLLQLALERRPDVQALVAAVRAAEASLRLAQANDAPTVQLAAQASSGAATAFSGSEAWQASLQFAKPIFQGGTTQALVAQARARLATADLDVEKAQQQVALQVTQSLQSLETARAQLAVAQDAETEARERARIADVRFRSGVGIGLEVLDAQLALTAAQVDAVNAAHDLNLAITSLRAATGLADLPKE
jgi:outer membrane protein